MIELRPLTGAELDGALDGLAALRIEVFRAWPYLYDGDLAYERRYLAGYGGTPDAILVGAWDGGRLVGAATGMPLAAHHAAEEGGSWPEGAPPVKDIFYCAESVLLPEYRGQGLGHRFFDYREDQARAAGFDWSCFAGVIRPADHPMRPADYRPLDPFWRKRGYAPLEGATERFRWKDLGETEETEKELQVWLKKL
ncbi:GNAT family N-acetyltransferase [Mangrovicoccus sp. HB161399]|uniref:GNAT family N-acetyltransferase n=1 Tax=Mangrovicoccus sp. HB161399 TaxID=2720392 RepID=UPI0015567412|nr:GNAT family N-acetyltransferase [Mangrovicoccus sp. HB161399]